MMSTTRASLSVTLRKTIDSLAQLKYDDKRKLILVICDGNIVGSGNSRPTPRIVLDILGADPNLNPEPLSFVSFGEGARQHNVGKVYSGLYECAGHVVPYLVVVKIGQPSERSRPGNRGKRDSQMVVMHFLNKVRVFRRTVGIGAYSNASLLQRASEVNGSSS
jgi:chitin synthase